VPAEWERITIPARTLWRIVDRHRDGKQPMLVEDSAREPGILDRHHVARRESRREQPRDGLALCS
jgi:hypothetical protein